MLPSSWHSLGYASPKVRCLALGTKDEWPSAMRTYRSLGLLLLSMLGACTDANVYFPGTNPPPKPEVAPNKIVGSFCAEDPKTIVFPLKVWLVIDDTGSMTTSDPNKRRYTAARELATRLASPGKMFFGGMIFADQRVERFSYPRFNDDVVAFNSQVPENAGNSKTPYLRALDETLSELRADIDEDPVKAKRTRYVIVFLSDGKPTSPDPTPPENVFERVDAVMSLATACGGVTLNTVYLGGQGDEAIQLLKDMAVHGQGEFKSFESGDELDYSGFDFSAIQRAYTQRFFLVTNRSMNPTANGQEVDSDQDGLDDAQEAVLGSNPLVRDSDGDGCSDAVEVRLRWDPAVKGRGECICEGDTATKDTDLDGLSDCEESWIGTMNNDPDSDIGKESATDGDLVPDELDTVVLQDPTFPNINSDRDLDGVLDIEELRFHTDVVDDDTDRARWAYTYPLFQKQAEDPRCYQFEVHNVTLGKTLATADHAEGENVIEAYLAQSAVDDPHRDRVYRVARKLVPYAEGDQVIHIESADFSHTMGVK